MLRFKTFFDGVNAGRCYKAPKGRCPHYHRGYKVGLWWKGLTHKERQLMGWVFGLAGTSLALLGTVVALGVAL